jgi:hypothetical protein
MGFLFRQFLRIMVESANFINLFGKCVGVFALLGGMKPVPDFMRL